MNIRICDNPNPLELSTELPGGDGALVHATEHEVYQYLKRRISRPRAMAEMRALLAKLGKSSLTSDHEVLREVADRIMRKRLFLVQEEENGSGGGASKDAPVQQPPTVSKRPGVSPPAQLPAPSGQVAKPVPVVVPELTAHLAQDVQAAGMVKAAVNGTPFCEVCERARRAAAGLQ